MTIVYCDWATGDDTTGDGSAGNPYKTITKASTSLTGGDEVRVAKSAAPTALTGTISFADRSNSITGTGTLFTTELAVGDFIEDENGVWCEIASIASDTAATLYRRAYMPAQSGVSSRKLGYTSTGSATSTQQVQLVSSSGTSSARLEISGGWDLSTELQDGITWFYQLNATFSYRYGQALYITGKNYVEISNIGFLRYRTGVYLAKDVCHIDIIDVTSIGCSDGIMFYETNYQCYVENFVCASASNYAIRFYGNCVSNYLKSVYFYDNYEDFTFGWFDNNNTVETMESTGCYNYSIDISSSSGNYFGNIIIRNADDCALYINYATDNSFGNLEIYDCGAAWCAIYLYGANLIVDNLILEGVTAFEMDGGSVTRVNKADITVTNMFYEATSNLPNLYIGEIDGYALDYLPGGTIYTQDATAGGSGVEWVLAPDSIKGGSYYPLKLSVAKVAVVANEQVTVSLYFKKSHATNVGASLVCRGHQIAGVTSNVVDTCPDDTNRNQLSIQFTPTENGVVEIEAWAWYISAAGTVIVDDIGVTQV